MGFQGPWAHFYRKVISRTGLSVPQLCFYLEETDGTRGPRAVCSVYL